MKITPLHERLLADILDLGSPYPLVLTGGYAVQAHGLVERFSRDLDVATETPAPMQEIVASLTAGLSERGWQTTHVQTDPLSGRFLVTDPETGEECEVDVLKEAFWAPLLRPRSFPRRRHRHRGPRPWPTAASSATSSRSRPPPATTPPPILEPLGRRRAHDGFSLEDLRDRLIGADWYEDEDYTPYGLTSRQIEELRTWALEWAKDLGARIHDENA